MSRAGLRGARRTRMYDCNYNAGQNYYKPALDNLDRKYYGRPLLSERAESAPRPSYFSPAPEHAKSSPLFDEPLSAARKRAEKVITEDAFFDVRGARVPKSSVGAAIDDFDDEFKSTLDKIRERKQKITNMSADLDFDDAVDSFKRRSRAAANFDAIDDDIAARKHAASSIRKVKVTTRREEEIEPVSVSKWTKVSAAEEDNSAASIRAKATKARLDDLETEMFERSEKQLAREKRSQQLKQFLADSDISI